MKRILKGLSALFMLSLVTPLTAQPPIVSETIHIPEQASLHVEDLKTRFAKLDTALAWLYQAQNEDAGRGLLTARKLRLSEIETVSRTSMARDGQVEVDLVALDVEALLDELKGIDFEVTAVAGRLVSGRVSVADLAELNECAALNQAFAAVSSTSAIVSEGDQAQRSDDLRTSKGLDGTGVKVGVISNSFRCIAGGEAADIASGDLPSGVQVLDNGACPAVPNFGTDEGRALAQIVHDVAPGADLAFHSGAGGLAFFASAVRDLAAAGADVIVEDVFNAIDSFFQDGVVAQAIEDVVYRQNVIVVGDAGNSGTESYESAFVPTAVTGLSGGSLHDFDPGPGVDVLQVLEILPESRLLLGFQWDDPWFSISGAPGARSDLDVLVVAPNGDVVQRFSSLNRNIGGDAVEVLDLTNSSQTDSAFLQIAVELVGGPAPGLFKYVVFNGGGRIREHSTNSPTVVASAVARGGLSVGAAAWFETPEFGQSPPLLESFSSIGSTPILFDDTGQRTLDQRPKPDVVGPDGGNNTFFGLDSGRDADALPNFFGTSAAAPHVAGIAALLKQQNPTVHPDVLRTALIQTAIDMDDPQTPQFDIGFDNASGYGFVDAVAASDWLD